MNLFAGVVSTFAGIPGLSEGGAEISAALGGFSGALWSGSAAMAPLSSDNPIPGAGTDYDTTLSDLINNASNYSTGILTGFDGAVNDVIGDYGKLDAAGNIAGNTEGGWVIMSTTDTDSFANSVVSAARMSLWKDVLRQKFGIRVAEESYPSSTHFGYWYTSGNITGCEQMYIPDVPAASTVSEFTPGTNSGKWDINIMSEGTTFVDQNIPEDIPMSGALASMLTSTVQQDTLRPTDRVGLNLPAMQFLENSNVTYSSIPVACKW
jgi:hypothetical protein